MDITQINLLNLKYKIDNHIYLSEMERDVLYRLFLSFIHEKPVLCDVIIVLGNPTCVDTRLPTAIDICHNYTNASIILCGGVCLPGKPITEAEAMKEACVNAGINCERIHLENNSTTTKENIIFAAPIVESLCIDEPNIVVVSSFSHMRRVMMNFIQYKDLFPRKTKIIPIASKMPGMGSDFCLLDDSVINEVSMELGYIHEYIYDLGYNSFSV